MKINRTGIVLYVLFILIGVCLVPLTTSICTLITSPAEYNQQVNERIDEVQGQINTFHADDIELEEIRGFIRSVDLDALPRMGICWNSVDHEGCSHD